MGIIGIWFLYATEHSLLQESEASKFLLIIASTTKDLSTPSAIMAKVSALAVPLALESYTKKCENKYVYVESILVQSNKQSQMI